MLLISEDDDFSYKKPENAAETTFRYSVVSAKCKWQ